ncbi:hypothetical protein EDD37DRAFT_606323 [Exophiala viscosa]|uniref:uncharacterized protein n=1 Tax=Exophiala viscosa TaxID=2486360 RepID=UPI00218E9636|nr:hypothetical protein EDD37DRAFT_606323 [Exophiala viscosa]
MVGIPGKSKACNTCRKRKIGCDLARPECGQYIKAKRHCEGYERETTFLNRTIYGWESRAAPKRAASSKPLIVDSCWTEAAADQKSFKSYSPVPQSEVSDETHTRRLISAIDPSRLYREKLLGSFLQDYLPLTEQSVPLDPASSFSWLQAATSLAEPGKVLANSLSGLALTRIGRKSGDQHLLSQGLAFHGQALRELQKALCDAELARRDETLAAVKTLALQETYENTINMHSWTAHERGVRQLYRLRGPEQNPSPLARLLHEDFRYTTVRWFRAFNIGSLCIHRNRSGRPDLGKTEGISPSCGYMPFVFAVVAMLECADKISDVEDAEEKFASRRQLLRLCQAIHERMEHWRERFLPSRVGTISSSPHSPIHYLSLDFRFVSIKVLLPI